MNNPYYPFVRKVPKSMPRKEAEQLIAILKEIKKSSEMSDASFSDAIKDETDLYRRTWISNPIELIIKRYEEYLNGEV